MDCLLSGRIYKLSQTLTPRGAALLPRTTSAKMKENVRPALLTSTASSVLWVPCTWGAGPAQDAPCGGDVGCEEGQAPPWSVRRCHPHWPLG